MPRVTVTSDVVIANRMTAVDQFQVLAMAFLPSGRALALGLVIAGLLGLASGIAWSLPRPRRLLEEFAGHLSHERYPEAVQLLAAPSAIQLHPTGGLVVVDHQGNRHSVAKQRLPFLVGGGSPGHASDLSMTALQGNTGDPHIPPPVTIYLSTDWGRLRIDQVEQ